VPSLTHDQRQHQADDDHDDRGDDDAAHAVTFDQRSREGRHQAEQHQPDCERARNLRGVPAEFLRQRQNQRAGHADRAGGRQRGEERDGDDDPAIMDPAPGQASGERIGEHEGAPGRLRLLASKAERV
jgi:hypothetical protein